MHRVLVLSALLTVAGSACAAPKPNAAGYGWYADYAAGKAEAQRTGEPMMLVFRCES
jgi:opacity protein-like surface antigen